MSHCHWLLFSCTSFVLCTLLFILFFIAENAAKQKNKTHSTVLIMWTFEVFLRIWRKLRIKVGFKLPGWTCNVEQLSVQFHNPLYTVQVTPTLGCQYVPTCWHGLVPRVGMVGRHQKDGWPIAAVPHSWQGRVLWHRDTGPSTSHHQSEGTSTFTQATDNINLSLQQALLCLLLDLGHSWMRSLLKNPMCNRSQLQL